MATSLDEISTVEDVTLCSICFEKFKKPRYLPCSHSFCHSCLSSYIVSVCTSTEPRLGFHCPLCREYIHCQGTFDKPEDIVNLFPENYLLEKIVEKDDQLNCEPCLRDHEEEQATTYCATCMENLCQNCTKCHKKGLTTKNHRLYPLSEIKSTSIIIVPESASNPTCLKHKNREMELFCNDHEALCCTMCVSTEHRKCDSVDTVAIAAQSLRESGKLSSLLTEVKNLEKKLTGSKARQEKNITEIEDSVDSLTEKARKELKTLIEHLQKLGNDLEQEISVAGKTSQEKLRKSLEIVTDGISCAKSCGDKVERVIEKGSDVELLMEYFSARATQEQMKSFQFTEKYISMLENKSEMFQKIKDMKNLSEIEAFYMEQYVTRVYEKELSFKQELNISDANFRSGTFLSNGTFIVANYKADGQCVVYDENFTLIKTIAGLRKPFAVEEYENELFVTCGDTKAIKVFLSSDYSETRSINLNAYLYGIACKNDAFYLACLDKILKIDKIGNLLKEYKTGSRVVNILTLKTVDIVYSNKDKHTVTAMSDIGNTLWEYKSSILKEPYGLERDNAEHIFVAGTESRNIHVLSCAGEVIRVISDMPKPVFVAVNEKRNVCYVCSEYKKIRVYELK